MSNLAHFPKVPQSLDSIVKPEQLVDIVEMTPISLQDRRNFNVLLGNAWNEIKTKSDHWIHQDALTKHTDSNNYDLPESFRRIMATIIVADIPNDENGEPEKRQIPLLGPNSFKEKRGMIKYSFPKELVDLIEKTEIFSRIHTEVMFALSSKYSLALYEWLQKRVNLAYIDYEVMPVEELRGILNVGDKLKSFGHLNDKAIKPALKEISYLTEYNMTAEPIKTGRAITHVKLSWVRKRSVGEKIAAVEELDRSKVGRKARMNQTAESAPDIIGYSQISDSLPSLSQKGDSSSKTVIPKLSGDLIEEGKKIARKAGTGWDIYAVEQEFYSYAANKGMPDKWDLAWFGFVKTKTAKAP